MSNHGRATRGWSLGNERWLPVVDVRVGLGAELPVTLAQVQIEGADGRAHVLRVWGWAARPGDDKVLFGLRLFWLGWWTTRTLTSSSRPASRMSTDTPASSESRAAATQPALPAPTTMSACVHVWSSSASSSGPGQRRTEVDVQSYSSAILTVAVSRPLLKSAAADVHDRPIPDPPTRPPRQRVNITQAWPKVRESARASEGQERDSARRKVPVNEKGKGKRGGRGGRRRQDLESDKRRD